MKCFIRYIFHYAYGDQTGRVLTEKYDLANIVRELLNLLFKVVVKNRGLMITKRFIVLSCSIFFLVGTYTAVTPLGVVDTFCWVKQKIVRTKITDKTVTRSLSVDEQVKLNKQNNEEQVIPIEPVKYAGRMVSFENDMLQCFEEIKDNPAYANASSLINPIIIVNGQEVMPGAISSIMTDNGKGFVTINLYKACVKQIYAMQHGPLRSVLMKLLQYSEPWLQWQYKVPFNVHDLEYVQLSALVLNAYQRAMEHNAAVNPSCFVT
jgi:hypothetical protein